jgi:hypothetical protein
LLGYIQSERHILATRPFRSVHRPDPSATRMISKSWYVILPTPQAYLCLMAYPTHSLAPYLTPTLLNRHSFLRCRNATPPSSAAAIPTLTHFLTGPPPLPLTCTQSSSVHQVKQLLVLVILRSGELLSNSTIKSSISNNLDTTHQNPATHLTTPTLFVLHYCAVIFKYHYRVAIHSTYYLSVVVA